MKSLCFNEHDNDVFFDSDFSYNRFSVNPSIDTMNRLNEIVKRQKLCAAQSATSAISNATLKLISRSSSQFDLLSCINSIHSIFSCSIHEINDVVSNLESDHFLLIDLTHQIIVDVVLSYKISQFTQAFDVTSKTIIFFRVKLIKEKNIIKMIDQFSTMTLYDVVSHHAEIVIMKCYSDVYQYDVNLWMLNTFLQKKWLCVFAIDDAILFQFVDATFETQYVSIAIIQKIRRQMKRDVDTINALILHSFINKLVISFNVSNSHWCVVMIECVDQRCRVAMYNSAFSLNVDELQRILFKLTDLFLANNSLSLWRDSVWNSRQIEFLSVIKQHDNHNCDIYIIRNVKILMTRQISSQHIVDIERLRFNYVRIFMIDLQTM